MALSFFSQESVAAAGDLDAGFCDGKGWVTTGWQTATSNDRAQDVIQQSDGKLATAGSTSTDGAFLLMRYNADGSLNSAWKI